MIKVKRLQTIANHRSSMLLKFMFFISSVGTTSSFHVSTWKEWRTLCPAPIFFSNESLESIYIVSRKMPGPLYSSRDLQETPKNKNIDRKNIDGGDMLNVVLQAMEKRVKFGMLSGPETSATMMATDFLLKELDQISSSSNLEKKLAVGGYAAAYGNDDEFGIDQSDNEANAIFGGSSFVQNEDDGW